MGKRRRYFILIAIMAFILLFVGVCNKEPQSELTIEEIVAKHYEQDFSYLKTYTLQLHTEKPLFQSVAADGIYRYDNYSGNGDLDPNDTEAEDVVDTAYEQNPYYTGYGEDVTYTYAGKRLVNITITDDPIDEMGSNLVWLSMYRAEYTTADDDVLAMLTQEYYIDYEVNQIIKIVTYLDEHEDIGILMDYLNNIKEPESVMEYLEAFEIEQPYSFCEDMEFYDFQ